jgi:ABC-2 type transport system ATP-binding protein
MEYILNTKDIRKSYGIVKALKGVSLQVPKGSVYGILGPNGSGKTTMLGILLDVLQADGGQYEWQGYSSPESARSNIGSLLETPNFYHYLSATDNLKISAAIKGRGENDIERVLKLVNLYNRKDSAFKTFSLGMKQRLAIAAALLGNPDVLVLDEPTNGLDPVGIAEIRNLILQLSQEGKTIIIASHLLDEVEKVCTHVAILKLGELITQGSVLEVLNDEDWIELGCADNEALLLALQSSGLCKQVRLQNLIIATPNKDVSIEVLSKWCFEHQFVLNHLVRRKRSLESKFIEITN